MHITTVSLIVHIVFWIYLFYAYFVRRVKSAGCSTHSLYTVSSQTIDGNVRALIMCIHCGMVFCRSSDHYNLKRYVPDSMLTKNSLEDVTNARRFCNIKMEPKESNDNKKQLKVKRQNNMRMTRVGRLLIQAAIVTLVWKFVWNVDSIVLFIINLIK